MRTFKILLMPWRASQRLLVDELGIYIALSTSATSQTRKELSSMFPRSRSGPVRCVRCNGHPCWVFSDPRKPHDETAGRQAS